MVAVHAGAASNSTCLGDMLNKAVSLAPGLLEEFPHLRVMPKDASLPLDAPACTFVLPLQVLDGKFSVERPRGVTCTPVFTVRPIIVVGGPPTGRRFRAVIVPPLPLTGLLPTMQPAQAGRRICMYDQYLLGQVFMWRQHVAEYDKKRRANVFAPVSPIAPMSPDVDGHMVGLWVDVAGAVDGMRVTFSHDLV